MGVWGSRAAHVGQPQARVDEAAEVVLARDRHDLPLVRRGDGGDGVGRDGGREQILDELGPVVVAALEVRSDAGELGVVVLEVTRLGVDVVAELLHPRVREERVRGERIPEVGRGVVGRVVDDAVEDEFAFCRGRRRLHAVAVGVVRHRGERA